MRGTVIAAAAFGGLCLLGYYIYQYYQSVDKELTIKEQALALILILFGFIALPLFGVVFAGIYEINNVMAAWQIGLTTPLIIKSVYLSSAGQAKIGEYQKRFTPVEPEA